VSTPENAELIVYLPVSSEWQHSECTKSEYASRLVVLDEGDGQGVSTRVFIDLLLDLNFGSGLFEPSNGNIQGAARDIKTWCLLYFKRSYVKRRNGLFNGFLGYVKYKNVFPLTYPIAEAYVRTTLIPLLERELLIACTLRGSAGDPVRSCVMSPPVRWRADGVD